MQHKDIHVFVSETRPYLQGARITAYELDRLHIPYTVITDSTSGFLMQSGRIQKVVVGSDRVASNGDLINKIGTYMHAIAANYHHIPFYTATSSHTIDFSLPTGNDCEIEYRDGHELTQINGVPITLPSSQVLYPAFDITPHVLLAGIITEKGVVHAPFLTNLQTLR
jgi:methylthioribose-1-phosphate isomerase